MKLSTAVGISVALAAAVSAGYSGWYWRSDSAVNGEQKRHTARSKLGSMDRTVIATGVVRPMVGAEVNVGSRISGTVVNLPVQVGNEVNRGQLLAELDDSALEAAVDLAEAELHGVMPRLTRAEKALIRLRRLDSHGLLSAQALEIASSELEIETARLESAEAVLKAAQIQLSYARIEAPISGVIARVSTREGETVAAGFSAPTFVTILDLNRLEVLAFVDQTDIGRISVGQLASFTVDTYQETEFSARVAAIEPRAQLQGSVVSYPVRLSYQPLEGRLLRPEMTAHVRLLLERREAALTVPRRTLRRGNEGFFVVVQRGEKWIEQKVTIGWRSNDSVEILSGLKAGESLEINPR